MADAAGVGDDDGDDDDDDDDDEDTIDDFDDDHLYAAIKHGRVDVVRLHAGRQRRSRSGGQLRA